MRQGPILSVIIISWNDATRLERCLKSIRKCSDEVPHEVIVVDDGSTDHTREMLKRFPWVRVIRNDRNLGMAPARNVGIRHAKGNYLLFLDSDTEVLAGCFANAVRTMAANPASWIGGCKTFRPDGNLENNARRFYSVLTLLYRRTPLAAWFPEAGCLRTHLQKDKDYSRNFVTDWVAGAALIIKREAIKRLGGFDPLFTYYFDDYDLCHRSWQLGGKVIYIADSRIVHHLSLGSRKSFLRALRHLRSGIFFYLKSLGLSPLATGKLTPVPAEQTIRFS